MSWNLPHLRIQIARNSDDFGYVQGLWTGGAEHQPKGGGFWRPDPDGLALVPVVIIGIAEFQTLPAKDLLASHEEPKNRASGLWAWFCPAKPGRKVDETPPLSQGQLCPGGLGAHLQVQVVERQVPAGSLEAQTGQPGRMPALRLPMKVWSKRALGQPVLSRPAVDANILGQPPESSKQHQKGQDGRKEDVPGSLHGCADYSGTYRNNLSGEESVAGRLRDVPLSTMPPARPSFLIIGAAKSGTTALFQYLAQHPEIFVCEPKEPHFMAMGGTTPNFQGPYDDQIINQRAITRIEDYEALFARSAGYKAAGEGSVSTLYYPENSIRNIKTYTPDARLICILRNPIDRAYSAYMYYLSLTREPVQSFEQAWDLEPERLARNYHHIWHYRRMGLYSEQLGPFMAAFGPGQLKVLIYDDFRLDPERVIRECCEFIGVTPDHEYDNRPEALVSGRPKNRLIQSILGRPSGWKRALRNILPRSLTSGVRDFVSRRNLEREPMAPAMRARLRDYYSDDVRKLEGLLGRDLSHWIETDGT